MRLGETETASNQKKKVRNGPGPVPASKKPFRKGLGHKKGTKRSKNRSKPFCNRFVTVFCVWEKPKLPQNRKNRSGTVQDRSLPQKTQSGTVWGTRTARNGCFGAPRAVFRTKRLPQKKRPRLTKLPCLKKLIKNGPGPVRASKTNRKRFGAPRAKNPLTLTLTLNPRP